jgi:hypothetical protein
MDCPGGKVEDGDVTTAEHILDNSIACSWGLGELPRASSQSGGGRSQRRLAQVT